MDGPSWFGYRLRIVKVRICEDVHCEQVEHEAVLLNLASGLYFGLDPAGARLWALLADLGTTEAVVEAALEEYEVSREDLERDVVTFAHTLAEHGLVKLG